jgi:uncharacterized membrane protein
MRRATPERLGLFSDGVFAVLITILVLELHPPAEPTYRALLSHWQQWLSYALSYLFIAIVWANHHYLLRHAEEVTPRLMWTNFAHLFSVSLLPFTTAWMATSRLAPEPVSLYALAFFLVNATYVALIWELVEAESGGSPADVRAMLRRRSVATLFLFAIAAAMALWSALIGLGICVVCLAFYLKPEPGSRSKGQADIS